jgi:hypothetical protein
LLAADLAAMRKPEAWLPMLVLAILSDKVEKLDARLDTLDCLVAAPEAYRGSDATLDAGLPAAMGGACLRGGGSMAPALLCTGLC